MRITLSWASALGGQTSVHSGLSSGMHSELTHALGSPNRSVHSRVVEHPSRCLVSTTTLQLDTESAHEPATNDQQALRSSGHAAALNPIPNIRHLFVKTRLSC